MPQTKREKLVHAKTKGTKGLKKDDLVSGKDFHQSFDNTFGITKEPNGLNTKEKRKLWKVDQKNFVGSEIMKNDNVFKITDTKRINNDKDVLLIATKRLNGDKVSPAVTSIKKDPPSHIV